jgi:hypothetical protein
MKINTRICLLLLAVMFAFLGTDAYGGSILHTKHNLSVSGPGPIKSPTEDRVCIDNSLYSVSEFNSLCQSWSAHRSVKAVSELS